MNRDSCGIGSKFKNKAGVRQASNLLVGFPKLKKAYKSNKKHMVAFELALCIEASGLGVWASGHCGGEPL